MTFRLSLADLTVLDYRLEDASLNSVLNGEYLGLPMPPSAVVMVQDESSLNHALEEIGKATIIGLDTEWQPAFGQAIEKRVRFTC